MRVCTPFDDNPTAEGVLLRVSGTGLTCIIRLDNGFTVTRHVSRVTTLDEDARRVLRK